MNNTIYQCLTADFWTKHYCWRCHQRFTSTDYQTSNHRLSFRALFGWKTISKSLVCLEKVLVELAHQQCPLFASYTYQQASSLNTLNQRKWKKPPNMF